MENQFQKWVYLSYFAVAGLAAYILFSLGMKISGTYDLEARVRDINTFMTVGSLLVGAILYFILWRNDEVNQFMNDVFVELSRVTWPTQKETSRATFIVIIMVVLSGLVLGFFDYFWTTFLKWIISE